MQTNSTKNIDDLIQGIRSILSNDRCSFSEEEQVLLHNCIEKLEKHKSSQDVQIRSDIVINIVGTLIRIFTLADHLKDLF